MTYLRQNTAGQVISLGKFVDDTDGNTPETGLTIANTDIRVLKHGATSFVNKNSGGATHIEAGIYYATFDATDSNTLGNLEVHISVSGALANTVLCTVLPAMVYDSLLLGTDVLEADVVSIAAGAITAAAIATDAIDADAIKADAVTEIQAGLATASALATVAGYLDTEVAAILADTNELQTDWANGGRLDLLLDTAAAPPSAASISDAVWDEALSGHSGAGTAGKTLSDVLVDTGTTLDTAITTIDSNVDALATVLDLVPTLAEIEACTSIRQTLALLGKNVRLFSPVYDADGNLTSCTIKAYPTSGDATADTNALLTLTQTDTYDVDKNLATHKSVDAA